MFTICYLIEAKTYEIYINILILILFNIFLILFRILKHICCVLM